MSDSVTLACSFLIIESFTKSNQKRRRHHFRHRLPTLKNMFPFPRFKFLTVFVIIISILLQLTALKASSSSSSSSSNMETTSSTTKMDLQSCLGTHATCYDGDCCAGLKCYYAIPSIGLEGFCERPLRMLSGAALTEKQLQVKAKYDEAMSGNLRKESS